MTHVVSKIAQVTAKIGPLAKKKHEGDTVNFGYRKIDDVIDALSPLMAEAGLIPRVEIIESSERIMETEKDQWSKAANANVRVTVKSTYAKVLVRLWITDGETEVHTDELGSSEDRGDKAQIQATSMGYKYAMMRIFNIPFSDKNTDTDGRYSDRYAEEMAAEKVAKEIALQQAAEAEERTKKLGELNKRLRDAVTVLSAPQEPGPAIEKLIASVDTFFKGEFFPFVIGTSRGRVEDAHKAFWTGQFKTDGHKFDADIHPDYEYDFEMGLKRKEVKNG